MNKDELIQCLHTLSLNQTEAAQLLSVSPRTVRRWLEGEEVTGPAEHALRAWIRLQQRNLPWRPDSVSIVEDDQQQIAAQRAHAIGMSDLLARVEARGGPRLPWHIDLDHCRAVLGKMEVGFYKLANGGFSLSTYTRKDGNPDVRRDWEFIEDAAFHIAKEMKKVSEFGPVTLCYLDGTAFVGQSGRAPSMHFEDFATNELAIQRVCKLITSGNFESPFIREKNSPNEVVWSEQELRQECAKRTKQQR